MRLRTKPIPKASPIGKLIRELREECKANQTDLAKFMKVSQSRISKIESGVIPDIWSKEFARILDFTVDQNAMKSRKRLLSYITHGEL